MSSADAAAFLDRVEQDEVFAADLADLAAEGDLSRVQARIRSAGYDASPDELRHAVLQRYPDDLRPEQLAAIAAGTLTGTDMLVGAAVVTASTISVVLAAAIAAS